MYDGDVRALAAVLAVSCAGAKPAPEPRELVAQAKAEYDHGNYGKAADLYDQVYALKPIPALLFNAGQAARSAHQYERAVRAYQEFLLLQKDVSPQMRASVEHTIATLQTRVDPLVAVLELRIPRAADAPASEGRYAPATPDSTYLTNVVRSVAADRGLNVMTRENVEVLLANRHATMADCVDKCEVEIARVLGADYVVSGEFLRTSDGMLRASVELHAAASSRFIAGAQAAGADVGALERTLRERLEPLFDALTAHARAAR